MLFRVAAEEESEDDDERGFLTNSPEPPEPPEPSEMVLTEAGPLPQHKDLAHIFRVGVSQP